MGSVVVAPGLKSTGSVVVVHGLSCSMACEVFLDQGLNPCLLHSQEDSYLLHHHGHPLVPVLHVSLAHRIFKDSIQFSHSVVSNSLLLHGLQNTRLPCLSPAPGVYSNSCPWCHITISSSVIPFSCLQSCPKSWSFPLSQFFASDVWIRSVGVSASASVLPMNIQDRFPLGLTALISL